MGAQLVEALSDRAAVVSVLRTVAGGADGGKTPQKFEAQAVLDIADAVVVGARDAAGRADCRESKGADVPLTGEDWAPTRNFTSQQNVRAPIVSDDLPLKLGNLKPSR